jgi:hypothetical protein
MRLTLFAILKLAALAPKLTFWSKAIEGSCYLSILSHNSIFKEQSKQPNAVQKKILTGNSSQAAYRYLRNLSLTIT